jgi:hypothetical protein
VVILLNKFVVSISSNIKLSLWKIGGILISDPFIPEIYLSMFHQFLQEEFMLVICLIISEIKLCEHEVEDVLKVLNPTKASGPDLINPRLLLKEAAPIIGFSKIVCYID